MVLLYILHESQPMPAATKAAMGTLASRGMSGAAVAATASCGRAVAPEVTLKAIPATSVAREK